MEAAAEANGSGNFRWCRNFSPASLNSLHQSLDTATSYKRLTSGMIPLISSSLRVLEECKVKSGPFQKASDNTYEEFPAVKHSDRPSLMPSHTQIRFSNPSAAAPVDIQKHQSSDHP